MPTRRVAITGLGIVSAVGVGREEFWKSLESGISGVAPVTTFPTQGYRSRLGAQVKAEFSPRDTGAYARAAAAEALDDAGLRLDGVDKKRAGIVLGTTFGECLSIEAVMARLGPGAALAEVERESAAFRPAGIPARLASELGFEGPNICLTTACAAGNFALAAGFEKLLSGAADLMLAGGVDLFSQITYAGFSRLLAVAPERCAPFSKGRQGLIPGEGCAILVLEPWEAALARGATPYAELLGYGMSSDARHVTAPDVDGVARAIAQCLRNAGLSCEDVDYISAHGTGTPANDKTETAAIKKVFGPRAKRVPVSAVKSMLGHAMGAASALQAAACCLSLRTGVLPPTVNFEGGDPDCDLDYVPGRSRRAGPRIALSNAFAFGGSNCVIALAAPGNKVSSPASRAREVVITGLGIVEGCADSVGAAQKALADKDTGFIDEPMAYALLGVSAALGDAGLPGTAPAEEMGIILDSSGELASMRRFHEDLAGQGPVGVEPRLFPNILANAAAGRAAIIHGLKLVNESLGGSFPGGESALARAVEFLRRHGHGAILAGGVSTGASVFAVETLAAARARGARVYAQVEVQEESFEPRAAARRKPSSCFCLAQALRKVEASGRPIDYRADGLWGGTIRLRLSPPPVLS